MKLINTPRIIQNLITHLKIHNLTSVISKEAEKQVEFLDMNLLKITAQVSSVDEALKVAIIHGISREQVKLIYADFLDIKNFINGRTILTDNKFLSPHASQEELLCLILD